MKFLISIIPVLLLVACFNPSGVSILSPKDGEGVLLPVRVEIDGDPPFDVYVDGNPMVENLTDSVFYLDDLETGPHILKVVSRSGFDEVRFEVIEVDATLVIYVTSSTSGPAVSGVEVVSGSSTALTNDEGIATLKLRTNRRFVDLHLFKYGYARSDVIDLPIIPNGTRTYHVLVRKPFLSLDPRNEKMIEVDAEFLDEKGEKLDLDNVGETFTVIATATSGRDVHYFYGALGKIPGADYMTGPRILIEDSETFGATFSTLGFSGCVEFHLVVYDYNENRTDRVYQMCLKENTKPEGEYYPPEKVGLRSFTTPEEIIFYSAPENSIFWLEISWKGWEESESSFTTLKPDGYRIYRSFDGISYEEAGFVPFGKNLYRDHSPKLGAGKRTFYRICSVYSGKDGKCSDFGSVVPLEPFRVELVNPKDGAVDIDRDPVFEVSGNELSSIEGDVVYVFSFVIWDDIFSDSMIVEATPIDGDLYLLMRNSTTSRYELKFSNGNWYYYDPNEWDFKEYPLKKLEAHKTYEWGMIESYAYVEDEDSTAYSLFCDRIFVGIPCERHNRFTTGR